MKAQVLINRGKDRFFTGYLPEHPMQPALEFDIPTGRNPVRIKGLAERIFSALNSPTPMEVGALTIQKIAEYHTKFPSLSVGDVVILNDVALSVESMGFSVIDKDDLIIVNDPDHCGFCGNPGTDDLPLTWKIELRAFGCVRCLNDPMIPIWDERKLEREGYERQRRERAMRERDERVQRMKDAARARDGGMDSVDWGAMDADLHICAGCGNAVDDVDDNNLCVECA